MAGRAKKTTPASEAIPKIAPILRMTWHLKKQGLERQDNVQNASFLPLVPTGLRTKWREWRRSARRVTDWQIRLSRVAAPANALSVGAFSR